MAIDSQGRLSTWDRLKVINKRLQDDEMVFLKSVAGVLIGGMNAPEHLRSIFESALVRRNTA